MCVCVHVHVLLWAEFDKLYQILGVTIQERGESFYNKMMPEMVQELERKGKSLIHTAVVTSDCRMSMCSDVFCTNMHLHIPAHTRAHTHAHRVHVMVARFKFLS